MFYFRSEKIPFQIDDDDYEIASNYKWYVGKTGYVSGHTRRDSKHIGLALHVLLLGKAPKGLTWDHIDRDKLNNHRSNLRAVTSQRNAQNRGLRIDNSSGVIGVTWHKARGKW